MAFVKVGKAAEVPVGTSKVYEVGDRYIAVCNVEGEFYAIDDVCTHDEAPLDQGFLEGCEIECPEARRAIRRDDGSSDRAASSRSG